MLPILPPPPQESALGYVSYTAIPKIHYAHCHSGGWILWLLELSFPAWKMVTLMNRNLVRAAITRRLRQVYNAPPYELNLSNIPQADRTFSCVNHVEVAAYPDFEIEECFRLRILYRDSENTPCSLSLQWSDFEYVLGLSQLLKQELGEGLDFEKVLLRLREVYGLQA